MEFMRIAGILLVITLQVSFSSASHFRGGTVSWKHLNSQGNKHQIEVNYRLGWRRDSTSLECDDATISSQVESYRGGSWTISTNYSAINNTSGRNTLPTAIKCTTYDPFENWAYGYNSFTVEVQTSGPFYVSYTGFAWIAGLYGGAGGWWAVPSLIDLAERSDTGYPNHPPRTFSPPVVRLLQGCPSTMQIQSVDSDGDRVTCRYAGSNNTFINDECAGVCNIRYPHFTLDESTCQIHYDGAGGTYLIPVALMLEDHPLTTITVNGTRTVEPTDYLSQVPLQFLVDISSTTTTCNDSPTYPEETIHDGETMTVSDDNGTFDEIIHAFPSDPNATIIRFVVLGPVGVEVSFPVYMNATWSYASNITWKPDPSQAGQHIICYYALDSLGKSGQQICFTVEVASILSPCEIANGGCSDVCLPQGGARTCGCSHRCYDLLENMRTCAPPTDITCDGSKMQIYLPSCASNRTVVVGTNQEFFSQRSCQSTLNGPNHVLRFTRQQCGVTEWSNSYLLRYHAHMWIWHEEERVSSIITRGEWKHFPVTCSVLTSSTSVNASFVPELPLDSGFFPKDITIDGMGVYSFNFEFYYSSSFSTAVAPADYPLQVSANDRMYFSLGAIGRGQSGLLFFTEQCTASSITSSGAATLTYTFIEDGCFLDPTLIRHNAPSDMQDMISMRGFEFEANLLSDRQNAEIFIECQVMICDASNSSTRCFQGCQQSVGRKRRSTQDGPKLQRHVRDVDDEDSEEESPQVTKSESPRQKANAEFILSRSSTTVGSGSSRDSCCFWFLFGITQIGVVLRRLLLAAP